MEVEVNIKNFLEVLNKIKHIAKQDKINPIFAHGMFEAVDNKLKITVASLINYAVVYVPAEIIESGFCLVEVNKLCNILSTMDGDVTIQSKEDTKTVWIKKDKIKCKLPLCTDSFPEYLTNPDSFEAGVLLSTDTIADAFKKVVNFTQEKVETVLGGVNLKVNDNIVKLFATDGNRLASVNLALKQEADVSLDVVIPADVVRNLFPLIPAESEVEINVNKSVCLFDFGDVKFYTRLIAGFFPQCEQLIPKSPLINFELNKVELKSALNRIKAMEEDKDLCRVFFTIKGCFATLESPGAKTNTVLTLENKSGDDIAFILNRYYLEVALGAIVGDKVHFGLNAPKSAILLSNMGNKFVIMPMG